MSAHDGALEGQAGTFWELVSVQGSLLPPALHGCIWFHRRLFPLNIVSCHF